MDFVADVRASTPTDAAKRVVPDLADELRGLAQARDRLGRAVRQRLDREQQRLDALRSRPVLARPESMFDTRAEQVAALRDRAGRTLRHRLDRADTELHHTLARLRALSPAATLERGYAVVRRQADGSIVRDPADAPDGDDLRIRVAGGELTARVTA